VLNGGTIPDRGLYGVYLTGDGGTGSRVGELDEEMVFETRPGDVFLLGASSWRVLDITHDRVLVAPAPGEPGRMPFWRGDGPGRPLEFGRAVGALTRQLLALPRDQAESRLAAEHGLDRRAATNLLRYLLDQAEATLEVPSDTTIVVESFLDEVGDWRVALLSPFGARVHAPWAMAVASRLRTETGGEVDMMWTDDGMVFRLPESDAPPAAELFFPASDEIEELVIGELGKTALFAARFRENAARALLLPRRRPGQRTPLWLQRRRSADLLAVAARYPDFPILLETYRECLRDVFDVGGLKRLLRDVEGRALRVHDVQSQTASPFAASLLFSYTANFLYDGDAPLAERRAQTLALDHSQLRELLGDAELRELLDAGTVETVVLQLQRLDGRYRVEHADGLHELLLTLGDLSRDELAARCDPPAVASGQWNCWIDQLRDKRRIIEVRVAGQSRLAAAEDASRYRDALGVVPPAGLPNAFLHSVEDPLGDLVSRYARTHGPFSLAEVAARFGLGEAPVRTALERLAARDRVLEGEFLPGGSGREWCDAQVLRILKRRSLACLRQQVEPVEREALARFLPHWQAVTRPRKGLDGLLDTIEQLQAMPLPASALDRDILPARVVDYRPSDLDELCAAGEVVWRGFEPLGPTDGRIALYLTDDLAKLAPEPGSPEGDLAGQVRQVLAQRGALFFEELVEAIGGFHHDILAGLWQLVWCGLVTNDTLAPLRSLRSENKPRSGRRRGSRRAFRSRRALTTPGTEGRWSMLIGSRTTRPTTTERQTALAAQLIDRYGILTRELVASEGIAGGFAGLYPVLKAMEEAGKIRRGYFVAGLGAAQFAAPGAEDQLRQFSRTDSAEAPSEVDVQVLAATDPANPHGTAWRWPATSEEGPRPQRAAGSHVMVADGRLIGYLGRTGQQLLTFRTDSGPDRMRDRTRLAQALASMTSEDRAVLVATIDGRGPEDSDLAADLKAHGFVPTQRGFLHRRTARESK
jgi:ATP-dependent Lhr-like helicase